MSEHPDDTCRAELNELGDRRAAFEAEGDALPIAIAEAALRAKAAGVSITEVARRVGCSRDTVYKHLAALEKRQAADGLREAMRQYGRGESERIAS